MKQLVFSHPEQKIPVICLYYGDFTEDGFKPIVDHGTLSDVFGRLFGSMADSIHFDKYFNNTPFIDVENFNAFFTAIIKAADSFSYYPQFLVCTLKSDDHGTKEEESQA